MNSGISGGCDAELRKNAVANEADEAAVVAPSEASPKVDSLTIALESIRADKAAAADSAAQQMTPDGFCKAAHQAQLLDNSHSRSRSGSSCDEDDRPQGIKRASSLKVPSGETSGTSSPRQQSCQVKKGVRFADAFGLDLACVRQVFDIESPPDIPAEATRDLVLSPSQEEFWGSLEVGGGRDSVASVELQEEQQGPLDRQQLYLSPLFAQPGSAPNFKSRVSAQKVVLEKAYLDAPASQIRGRVRVANIGFEKSVQLRVTFDEWRNTVEIVATYDEPDVDAECSITDAASGDQFSFIFGLPHNLRVGDRVAFCVMYSASGQTFWDNNFGDNYSFHCVAMGQQEPGKEQVWTRYI